MSAQSQVWMPAVLSLFGTLIVVVLTAWLNTWLLSTQIHALRSEMRAQMRAFEERVGRQIAELELRLTKQISELGRRIEGLEETRGLVRP